MERTTRGCSRHGHPEFVLSCADEFLRDLEWLCNVLEDSVASGQVFTPGDTFQLGWSVLMIRNAPGGRLALWELDLSGVPGQLDCSVTRSLMVLRRQKGVLESFGMAARPEFPSLRQTAVKCARFESSAVRMLSRSESTGDDSGWFFGCTDQDHDHDRVENLQGGPLYDIVCANPTAVDFLAMPAGSIVVLNSSGGVRKAFGPGGSKLLIERGSYLDLKRSSRDS